MDFVIEKLNALVHLSGEPLEGCICYSHHCEDLSQFEPAYHSKRQLWATLCSEVDRVVEVGLNAGHSAALALAANPALIYVGIDPGGHSYTRACARALSHHYGHRFTWLQGLSQDLLAGIAEGGPTLWSIDGEHTLEAARWDLSTAERLSQPGDLIWFDDADSESIAAAPQVLTRSKELARSVPTVRIFQRL